MVASQHELTGRQLVLRLVIVIITTATRENQLEVDRADDASERLLAQLARAGALSAAAAALAFVFVFVFESKRVKSYT